MYITGRARRLIQLLLHAEQAWTVKELADTLDVSERTIHRDLNDMDDIFDSYHLELIKRAGVGLHIKGSPDDKEALQSALSQDTKTDYTPEERRALVFAALLHTKDPVKLYALASDLHVTIATISNDLDQLEEEMAGYHLELQRKRGYGVILEGDEAHKRAALSQLVTKYMDASVFVSLLKENIRERGAYSSEVISNRLLGMVDPNSIRIIEKQVEKIRDELPYELADSAYVGLVVHLALAIERLKKGERIQFDPSYLAELKETTEFTIAKKLIQDLSMTLEMTIPYDEIGYITMHLLGAKLRVNQQQNIADTDGHITYRILSFIQYVGDAVGTDLTRNISLQNDLIAHLNPSLYRMQQGMNIYNPLLDDIRERYADLFQIVQQAVQTIFAEWTFPDDEIGFLVLHFASALMYGDNSSLRALVICSSGIGTAKILASNLTKQFPEIKQVENISLFDLSDTDPDTYDLIVSTVPLEDFAHAYILASPMLRERDIHHIKKHIQKTTLELGKQKDQELKRNKEAHADNDFMDRLEHLKLYTTTILRMMRSFQVDPMDENQSMETTLAWICADLAERQVVRDANVLKQTLLNRAKFGGLGIPSTSMTLLHTKSKVVIHPTLTIYTLAEPISVEGMDGQTMQTDTLLLMLAEEEASEETLEIFSYISSLLIDGEANASIFQSADEQWIRNLLLDKLEWFVQEKDLI